MKPIIKELTGKVLTKELHDDLLSFNGNTLIRCIIKHSVRFNSGLSERTQINEIGDIDRLTYVFFEPDTYKNWIIEEVK